MAKKRRDRRSFSDEYKQQLIDEINSGKKLIDVAEEHGLQPSQLSLWKKKLGAGSSAPKKAAPRAKSSGKSKAAKSTAPKSETAPATAAPAAAAPAASASVAPRPAASSSSIAELERVIGQLTVENMRLRSQLESK